MSGINGVTILALDPSTDVTGAVIVRFGDDTGVPMILATLAFDATAIVKRSPFILRDRLARIRETRHALSAWIGKQYIAIDAVAYETDTERGHSSTEALKMAAGAYLSLSDFAGLPVYPVTRQAACVATGTGSVYREPAGKNTRERDAKKARLKNAVVEWANNQYPLFRLGYRNLPMPEQECVADALAVAESAKNTFNVSQICRPKPKTKPVTPPVGDKRGAKQRDVSDAQ